MERRSRKNTEAANEGVDPEVRAERAKRIAVASTAAGVLLIIFLIVVLIVQFVQIGVRNSERAKLNETIARYEQMNENSERNLEYYQSEFGAYQLALEAGYKTKG